MEPVNFLASFTFILSGPILLLECVHTMTLVACSLSLVAWDVELERLQLFIINCDPGPELLPSMTHDLELSCDGLQLWP